jgi:hypothetical protein
MRPKETDAQRAQCPLSATKREIRGHCCGMIILEATKQHVRAEQNDRQQAIYEIGKPLGPMIDHRCIQSRRSYQLFVVDFAS